MGWDFESFLMDQNTGSTPRPVCISYADNKGRKKVLSTVDAGYIPFLNTLVNPEVKAVRVAHNLAFDLCLVAIHYPELLPKIFECLEKGYFVCTKIREQLLNLATLGWITDGEVPGGRYIRRRYDLATLVLERFNTDISGDKKDPLAWRLRYGELYGLPAAEYPQKAYDYSLEDSVWAVKLYDDQEARRQHVINTKGFDPFDFEGRCFKKIGMTYDAFKSMVSFDAGMVSANGLRVNKQAKYAADEMLKHELSEDKLCLLYEKNLLIRAQPPMPHKNLSKAHVDTCGVMKIAKSKRPECECPLKMKPAEKEKLNKKLLGQYAIELYMAGEIETLVWSPKGKKDLEFKDKFKAYASDPEKLKQHLIDNTAYISLAKEFFAELEGLELDPVLAQFVHRNKLSKIQSSALPAICLSDGVTPADIVWPCFDVLKVTSRLSSYGSNLYPSMNIQQVDARMRQLIIPREKHWFYSIDYASLEFISAASRLNQLGIDSVYLHLINEGGDCHAYLAAALAYELDPDQTFKKMCDKAGVRTNYEKYTLFRTLKKSSLTYEHVLDKVGKPYNYFKYWRTFAKPVGLGTMGGMGAKTLSKTAKVQYGLSLTEDQTKEAKKVTLKTIPEIPEWLAYVKNKLVDFEHTKTRTKEEPARQVQPDGSIKYVLEKKQYKDARYVYTSPLGLRRPNCQFTQCANGGVLQTPSAEGVQVASHLILKETLLNTNSPLHKNHLLTGLIHDELVGDVVADSKIATPVIERIMLLMDRGLEFVCEGVKSASDPALMFDVWSKAADKYEVDGLLYPFEFDPKWIAKQDTETKERIMTERNKFLEPYEDSDD